MHIVEKEPKSIAAESYRTLRTNIEYSSFDEEARGISRLPRDSAMHKCQAIS